MEKGKKVWESLGATDAYFAVYSVEKYLDTNLDESAKHDFFDSGREHVVKLWQDFEKFFGFVPKPKKVLDFGCGVGRLLLALAERTELAVGVDISESMLQEAEKQSKERGIENVDLMETSELLNSQLSFDMIHSFVVIQHIDPSEGMKIIQRLVEMLDEDGIGMLHITFHDPMPTVKKIKHQVTGKLGSLRPIVNRIRGRNTIPWIPIYTYNMDSVLELLRSLGCYNISIKFTDHGVVGAMIFLQKSGTVDYS